MGYSLLSLNTFVFWWEVSNKQRGLSVEFHAIPAVPTLSVETYLGYLRSFWLPEEPIKHLLGKCQCVPVQPEFIGI